AGRALSGAVGEKGRGRRFIARTRHRKPYASHFGGGRGPMISRPMGRRTETSMAPSSRRQRLAALVADRVAHTAGSLARSSMASSARDEQLPADLDDRKFAALSGVIGPVAAQSEIFLPGRGDRSVSRDSSLIIAFLLIQVGGTMRSTTALCRLEA